MICPNCGTNNEDTYQFCMKCGSSLSGIVPAVPEEQQHAVQVPTSTQPASPPVSPQRKKDLLKEKVTPAEGEVSVRTYYCTYYLSRLLGLEAWGYLAVTNKRIIFQALGTSTAGSSVIQSELPIADVSGISSYKGTYFSFGHLATAFIASWIGAGVVFTFTALFGIVLIGLIISTSLEAGANSYIVLQAVGLIMGVLAFMGSLSRARHSIWKSILAAISSVGLIIGGGGSLLGGIVSLLFRQNENTNILAGLSFFFALLVIIYTLFCIVWYSQRPTFALAISSKGGSDTPISISGASSLGLFNVTAGKALTAEPAADVDLMLQELGAVILDVQTLGDMGINKWKIL